MRAAGDASLGTVVVDTVADAKTRSVSATLSTTVPTYIMHFVGRQFNAVSVKASAKLAGGAPVCVLGLDINASGTINLEKDALLNAPNCAIYSNSKKAGRVEIEGCRIADGKLHLQCRRQGLR